MTRLALLIALVLLPPTAAYAQEIEPPDGTRISSAQVSGIDMDRLSPGLREDIGKLAGTPLDRQRLRDLAARIEAEQPRYVAALRYTTDADGSARVVFVVGRVRDQDINARYIVDEVEIRGIDEARLDKTLRDDLHALVGKPLDSEEAERLVTRLKDALPDYRVMRSTTRGAQPGRLKLIYILIRPESAHWLRFEPFDANALFHSDQGWGANLALGMGGENWRVTPIIPIDNGDDLIEEYSGFGLRVESRNVGTERLGVFFEWSTYDQDWRDETLFAMTFRPDLPALYRNRMSVTPLVKFAFTPQVSVGGGVAITELDSLVEPGPSRMANAGIGFIRFHDQWQADSGMKQQLDASFTARAGTTGLQSDLVYQRYFMRADYVVGSTRQQLIVSAMGGAIDGDAPMFERFSLGDSRTLRGWNKWAITPVGGDRMFSTTLEFRYRIVSVFFDSGSVWDTPADKHLRFSTGVSFNPGPVFFTLGFPLNTDEFRAVFTMGLRFPQVGFRNPW
ncbi:MAG TPA: BamA/TamA family outer membrane protein [Vicinamibacterales bacterium]|nr:BamA/TamA family outer membrane protein [Vicinamibacterales bacterium]